MSTLEINRRRTFAIVSHPDAGKTTLTEKLLLFGGAIQLAGSIKSRKASRHAVSDWMELERQRGISVTTSVMQFEYADCVFNLLDTPGHADFSEDTYRTLTAVDSALMVIDAAKGVEERTIKLLDVCRMRTTPILTFINKLDRDAQSPIELIDNIERVLKIHCVPMNWPLGSGRDFRGVYDLNEDTFLLYESGLRDRVQTARRLEGLHSPAADELLGSMAKNFRAEIELVRGASQSFERDAFLNGTITPVYFGSAMNNFGVEALLKAFVTHAPAPLPRITSAGEMAASHDKFSGFVFKIQANMDAQHHDRIAFLRICSGRFQKGMRLFQVRTGKELLIHNAVTFLAKEREHATDGWAGDIIGLHNHGGIQIGDTFTLGEKIHFLGIPHFSPELFRRVILRDPLKSKALNKGLQQLAEEGSIQVFKPFRNNDLIVGAVGTLQFEVMVHRLKSEYGVDCTYEAIPLFTARWVDSKNEKKLDEFRDRLEDYLAFDSSGALAYLAPSKVNLQLAQERWPDITFTASKELQGV